MIIEISNEVGGGVLAAVLGGILYIIKKYDLGTTIRLFLIPRKKAVDTSDEADTDVPPSGMAKLLQEIAQSKQDLQQAKCDKQLAGCDKRFTKIEARQELEKERIEERLNQGNERFNDLDKIVKDIPKIRNISVKMISTVVDMHYDTSVISKYLEKKYPELVDLLDNTESRRKALEQLKFELETMN